MPRCALPDHLDEKEEIENAFPDDSQYKGFFGNLWKRWNKMTKAWDAWGPRCPRGIAFSMWPPWILLRKWRETPIILWADKGAGHWRYENDEKPDIGTEMPPHAFLSKAPGYYLSRNQYWCRWHFQIAWPLFFCWHRFNDTAAVVPVETKEERDGQLKMAYIGAKRDADKVFWYIAAFFGNCFK